MEPSFGLDVREIGAVSFGPGALEGEAGGIAVFAGGEGVEVGGGDFLRRGGSCGETGSFGLDEWRWIGRDEWSVVGGRGRIQVLHDGCQRG